MAQNLRINERIRISPIRLISETNEQVGIVPVEEAQKRARDAGMDLVEVAPMERPPVCRIMDYGKWKYQQKKKQKGRHGHEVQIKEVRLRPKTDPHDREIKVNRALRFLEAGDKVQFTMLFRGRERFHVTLGLDILKGVAEELEAQAKVERPPKMEGRRMTMLLAPTKTAPKPKPKSPPPEKPAAAAPAPATPEQAAPPAGETVAGSGGS